jgi:hypothetical protein
VRKSLHCRWETYRRLDGGIFSDMYGVLASWYRHPKTSLHHG